MLFCLIMAIFIPSSVSAELKMGIVNLDQLLKAIPLMKESQEKIKKQFIEDLKDAISNGDGEIDDYCQLYSSFLYCNGEYVWGGTSF